MEKHAEVGAPPEAAPLEGSTVEGARWGSMPRFPAKSSTARSEALLRPPCRAARAASPRQTLGGDDAEGKKGGVPRLKQKRGKTAS